MKLLSMVVLAAAAALTACEDPAANKPRALISDVVSVSQNGPSGVDVERTAGSGLLEARGTALSITPENSEVGFTGSKVTGRHDGGFRSFIGVIDLVDARPENSRVAVEIEIASVFSDDNGLTEHLKTGDFFEVEKHPKARFSSTRIDPDSTNGENGFLVTGDLELRGVVRSITFPATIKVMPGAVSVNAEFAINRKEFGIMYAGKADDLIRDDVVIRLALNTARN